MGSGRLRESEDKGMEKKYLHMLVNIIMIMSIGQYV